MQKEQFNKQAKYYDEAAFLFQEIALRLDEHLDPMSVEPQLILDLGCGTGALTDHLKKRYPGAVIVSLDFSQAMLLNNAHDLKLCADFLSMPFKSSSFDLVLSNMALLWCDDLKTVFKEVHRVLKPHGLFSFSSLGPDTLKESADDLLIHRVDMHDLGDQLLQHKLVDPVMDVESVRLSYESLDALQAECWHLLLLEEKAMFELDDTCSVTFEVVYGHAWKSDKSFQENGEVRVPLSSIQRKSSA